MNTVIDTGIDSQKTYTLCTALIQYISSSLHLHEQSGFEIARVPQMWSTGNSFTGPGYYTVPPTSLLTLTFNTVYITMLSIHFSSQLGCGAQSQNTLPGAAIKIALHPQRHDPPLCSSALWRDPISWTQRPGRECDTQPQWKRRVTSPGLRRNRTACLMLI